MRETREPAGFAPFSRWPSFLKNASVRLTPEGWCWLLIAGFLWGIGFSKGINLFLLLSYLMLLLLALNLVLAGRQLRRLSVRRRIVSPIFAGEPVRVDVELARAPVAALGIRVEDRGEAHLHSWFFDQVDRRCSCPDKAKLVLARGWYAWGPALVLSGYPFGLVERNVVGEPPQSVLVYPRRGALHRGRFRRFLDQAAPGPGNTCRAAQRNAAGEAEFHGLREFRAGDSLRRVHWRTSARRGELMIQEFEDRPPEDLIIVFDPWLPSSGRQTEIEEGRRRLEAAIVFTATICGEWCREHGARLLLAVASPAAPIVLDGHTTPAYADLLLECLALIQGGPTDVNALCDRLAQRAVPRAPILFVGTRPPASGNELARRLGRPVVFLDVGALPSCDFYDPPAEAL